MNILHVLFCVTIIGRATGSLLDWGDARRHGVVDDAHRQRRIQRQWATSNNHNRRTEHGQDHSDTQNNRRRRYTFGRNDMTKSSPPIELVSPSSRQNLTSYSRHGFGNDILLVETTNRVKMWPPWPLNLLTRAFTEKASNDEAGALTSTESSYASAGALFWAYGRGRAKIWVRQLQEVGSQLWFNLPPAAPPLILLASIPRTMIIENKETGVSLAKRVVPLFSNPFARNLALSGLGLAVMSWAHMEVNRKKRLTPILSAVPYSSVSRVFLPPFLPDEVPEPEIEALQSAEEESLREGITQEENEGEESNPDADVISRVNPRLRKQLYQLYEKAPNLRTLQTTLRDWGRMRQARQREAAKIRRLSIFDELVALQALKRQLARRKHYKETGGDIIGTKSDTDTPGYALVTGASHGIGRAIAVELARWEIPLILVARDMNRLISLAYDLEACYGVKCCVLQADLSESQAAEKVYRTTNNAGLCVEILVNNAGFSTEGLAVDTGVEDVERMIMVNAMSYAKLSRLYGKDMKERKRGRILMVSSMCGLTSASPGTAVYGATKAFAKSLSLSMAKELEPYGVGVTCLMPGPVVGTQFRQRSGTDRALCWYIPYYARPVQSVAHQGVMSLLDGDTQVIPGVINRVFAKLCLPLLPQRVEIMSVHFAWSPLVFTAPKFFRKRDNDDSDDKIEELSTQHGRDATRRIHTPIVRFQPRYTSQPPPRLLELPEPERLKIEENMQSSAAEVGSVERSKEGSENELPKSGSKDLSDAEQQILDEGGSVNEQDATKPSDNGENARPAHDGELGDKDHNVIRTDTAGRDGRVTLTPSDVDNFPRCHG
jgi:uncharacterized protein